VLHQVVVSFDLFYTQFAWCVCVCVCVCVQLCVPKRQGYGLRNASLGEFVVVRTCTYTNVDLECNLLLIGYKPVQHVTVLNTAGNCNTMVL
jgi:hypothetical protein